MAIHHEHRILIVDDSFRNLSLMQKLLKSWGYADCSVNSTEHTPNRLQRDNFDLIIVDKVFSSTKELEVAKKIRKIQPCTPIICSADEDQADLAQKPKVTFRPFQKLRNLLQKVIENRECYDIVMI
ncbi:MAG: response regulator [Roseivirga sp.]|nr:response regulator [Roseivirga sp.]